jgi:23S rRNA (uridine2552-2'-O)-methyltransferase
MERRKPRAKPSRKKPKARAEECAPSAPGVPLEKRGLKKTSDKRPAAGQRDLRVVLKTAKGRKVSSTLWLERQLNDPYVARAKAEGYRSRAAYKLKELNEKFHLIRKGARVIDLGSAPGGWLQVAAEAGAQRVVGIDCLPIAHVPGAEQLELDFLDARAPDRLKALIGGEADLVLSDMAAPTTGHRQTDHLRIVALAEAALDFALDVLAPGGAFVSKVLQGGAEGELLARLKKNFASVRHAKPRASRAESAEMYVVATGFKGAARA